ncbi:MAG: Lrp/AsnC family transcriptional regulator [Pseudomonadota bacterium]
MSKTDGIRNSRRPAKALDRLDRKILGELVRNAGQSYAEIGKSVGLSAPATHERVRKLRANGIIRGTSAQIDGKKIGKPLLVFVHVNTQSWGHSEAFDSLAQLPELEEMHSVAGATSMILKMRVEHSDALEALLRQINGFASVVSTHTFVTLSTYLERSVQAQITTDWPDPPRPLE